MDRRAFLGAAALVAAGAAAAGGGAALLGRSSGAAQVRESVRLPAAAEPAPPLPPGIDPGFVTANPDFYRVDTALTVPRVDLASWRLTIGGLVDSPVELSFADLLDRPLVERVVTLNCVSNEVGGPYISTANFVGVALRDVLDEAGVQVGADQLVGRSSDGWNCGTPTEVVLEPGRGALLALAMNGEPLPAEHGFPVRVVVPGLYGYVSATKWLVDLELTTFDAFTPYWARRGWARRAPIKTMSLIDRPSGFQRVPAGRVAAAGIAWAQHKGVDAVEVKVDGGTWIEATLASEVNLDTWRMWRAELDVAPGRHTVEVRATDKTGYTQTADRADPIPDGATGWHSVVFVAV